MEISDAQTCLRDNHHGVLVVRKKDGSLQMTLVPPVIDAEGKVIITARDSTYKVKNIKRDPRISLLVYGDKFNGSDYIQIDGKAEVIEHPGSWILSSTGTGRFVVFQTIGMISGRKRYPKAALLSASPSKMPARRVKDKHNDLTALPPSPKRSTQPLLFLSSLLAFLVFLETFGKVCFGFALIVQV